MRHEIPLMRLLAQIVSYLPWVLASLAMGLIYFRLLIGPNPAEKEGLWAIFYWFYRIASMQVGLIIGAVIAVLFIAVDLLILRQKLGSGMQATSIRIACLVAITGLVALTHYILEKVLDVF